MNDTFEIRGLEGIDGVKVKIFNRYGTVVFESDDYGSAAYWDGDDLPDATYFYVVEIPGIEGHSGSITISR